MIAFPICRGAYIVSMRRLLRRAAIVSGFVLPATPAFAEITPSHAVGNTHDCGGFYPALSTRLNESGDVTIGYDVDAEGNIFHVHVVKTSGNDRLDNAAAACVASHWRNTPAMDGTTPVVSPNHRAIIAFRLRDRPETPSTAAAPVQSTISAPAPKAPVFRIDSVPWDQIDRGLFDTLKWVIAFFGACGLAAFVNWLISRPRDPG